MKTAVLTYHAVNIGGSDYASNDHVALKEDLHLIEQLGLPVVSLRAAVAALDDPGGAPYDRAVALSCDDGSWFDWYDLPHPSHGRQRGFRGILEDYRQNTARIASMTSFVIASPGARADLDRRCLIDRGWWGEDWWGDAAAGDLISIENHSWDHNHVAVEHRSGHCGSAGGFSEIEEYAGADAQIRQASDYIDATCGPAACSLFAYPYGESSDYLRREYLPDFRHQHRMRAAFTTDPMAVHPGADRWSLGRYVCGFHWKSPEQLQALLRDALSLG